MLAAAIVMMPARDLFDSRSRGAAPSGRERGTRRLEVEADPARELALSEHAEHERGVGHGRLRRRRARSTPDPAAAPALAGPDLAAGRRRRRTRSSRRRRRSSERRPTVSAPAGRRRSPSYMSCGRPPVIRHVSKLVPPTSAVIMSPRSRSARELAGPLGAGDRARHDRLERPLLGLGERHRAAAGAGDDCRCRRSLRREAAPRAAAGSSSCAGARMRRSPSSYVRSYSRYSPETRCESEISPSKPSFRRIASRRRARARDSRTRS